MRFEGRVWKEGAWWAIEVPLLGVVTQGKTKKEAYEMVQDALEALAGSMELHVDVHPGKSGHFEVSSSTEAALFALFLKRQRQMQGLSLSDVSDRLGLKSRNAYARYEQGRSVPTLEKLSQLVQAVNPEQSWVFKMSA